jgi:ketosteroid isomerase-like protein
MENERITEHIIALEHAALVDWCHGNPSTYLALYAPELTYFDPFTPERWDLPQVREMYERIHGMQNFDRFEIVSPHVQIHGEVAVLSFNYTSEGFDGMWNCTEVYRRVENGERGDDPDGIGTWRIIHNHWSDVHPKQ